MSRFAATVIAALFALAAPFAGAQAINLDSTLRAAGATANASSVPDLRRWKIRGFTIEAQDRKPYVTVNGTRVYTGSAISCANGKIFIQKRDWEKHVAPIVAPAKTGVPAARKIVIDAGHGGSDPGKIQGKMREKAYTLDVAKRLQRILKARGFTVEMTRSRDEAVDLAARAEKANAAGAHLFVSVHFNAASAASARGVETWMLTPVGEASFAQKNAKTAADAGNRFDAWNLLLAYRVQSALSGKIDAEDRGVKCANFAVLRTLKCPGILVECGFFTNASEAALLATTNRREQIAQGIAEGVVAYAGALDALRAADAGTRKPRAAKRRIPSPRR